MSYGRALFSKFNQLFPFFGNTEDGFDACISSASGCDQVISSVVAVWCGGLHELMEGVVVLHAQVGDFVEGVRLLIRDDVSGHLVFEVV